MSCKSVLQECPTRSLCKRDLQFHNSLTLDERLAVRVFHESVSFEYATIYHKSVLQECLAGAFYGPAQLPVQLRFTQPQPSSATSLRTPSLCVTGVSPKVSCKIDSTLPRVLQVFLSNPARESHKIFGAAAQPVLQVKDHTSPTMQVFFFLRSSTVLRVSHRRGTSCSYVSDKVSPLGLGKVRCVAGCRHRTCDVQGWSCPKRPLQIL